MMKEALRRDAWRALQEHFDTLSGRLQTSLDHRSAVARLNTETQAFPFYAYLSIPLGASGDHVESIDLVVSFFADVSGLRMTSDASFDHGELIAAGPHGQLDPGQHIDEWVLEGIARAGSFFLSLEDRLQDRMAE